ncbi:MAG TPA: HD domain-containing protein [Candidatus Bilamarchaeaceae archaeon]|nr:HD domain-containing protein [Candidatus Bilamarchaeaceae archaeon]
MAWEKLEKALDNEISKYPNAQKVLTFLRTDNQVNYFLSMSNCVTVTRMGYNDHGKTHARIAALNAMRALKLLNEKKIIPNLVSEFKTAEFGDSLEIVLFSAFLHDIGNSIIRQNHEVWGMVLVRELLNRFYEGKDELSERKKLMIMEGILCHMGQFVPSSIESKIIALADGCDMESGRARIPYSKGKKDIHSLSALGVTKLRLKPGKKKPIKVDILLNSSSGVFQIEEVLIKKIKGVQFEDYVEISAFIESRNETIKYLVD